jgi:hypothetical protein
MAALDLPGGMRIQPPDPTARQIIEVLSPLLVGLQAQLDLLIRMESGALSRHEVKQLIVGADAAAAGGNGQGPK